VIRIPSDPSNFNIVVRSGDHVGEVVNTIAMLALPHIRNHIVTAVQDMLPTSVPPLLNNLVDQTGGASELYNGLMLDWSSISTPHITPDLLYADAKGIFFKKDQEEHPLNGSFVLPQHDANATSKVQLFLSNNSVNSFASAFVEVFNDWFVQNVQQVAVSTP
jgi:hypothetical protein